LLSSGIIWSANRCLIITNWHFPIIARSVVIVGDNMDGTSAPYYWKRALFDTNEGQPFKHGTTVTSGEQDGLPPTPKAPLALNKKARGGVTDHPPEGYRLLKFFRYSATDRVISALKSDMYFRLQSASMLSLSPRSLCIPRSSSGSIFR
jgi:hypothetical protein